jgi:cytochrome c peroxidase
MELFKKFALLTLVVVAFVSCKKGTIEPYDEYPADEPYNFTIGNMTPPTNLPGDNPLTREGVKLGRMLFYDKILSKDNSQACASCHLQNNGFSDPNQFSTGVNGLEGPRNSMSSFNMAWNDNGFFWDGRAALLRHQVLLPIQDELEMDEALNNIVSKLNNSQLYKIQFKRAFGIEVIDTVYIAKALEQFILSIVSNNSKYDKYLAGEYTLTQLEERGRFLFFNEVNPGFPQFSGADCVHCHSGANFSNNLYMNNGLDIDADMTDLGRQLVTNSPSDKGKFKVVTLRNIELTAPYMHDGRFNTLEEVIDHYDLVKNSSTLDPSFEQQLPNGLQLSAYDKSALVAFLKLLTDESLATDSRFSDPF